MNKWASTAARRDRPQARRNCTPAVRNHHRHSTEADAAEDLIKCSGKSCQSCLGGLIADCVAICCCPCAVVNILALAFLKVPWTIGKRALKLGKKKLGKNSKGRRSSHHFHLDIDGDPEGNGRAVGIGMGMGMGTALEKGGTSESVVGAEELKKSLSARFEEDDEELWFELYQVGHMGFGRVSFTGISSSLCKGQLGEQQPIIG